jgi:hypothetical protein
MPAIEREKLMANSKLQADLYRQDGPCLRKHRQPDALTPGRRIRAWEDDVKINSIADRAIAHARYALKQQSNLDLGPQRNEGLGGGAIRRKVRMQTAIYNWGIAINLGIIVS